MDQPELARRLRLAREACRLRQEDAARHLGVSRSAIAQIEGGKRAVTSLELDRLAYLYGRDIRELLADDFNADDALVALFRLHPESTEEEQLVDVLRDALAVGREIQNLEQLLEIDRDPAALASYGLEPPRSKWDAVRQGERVADAERGRLGLGTSPLADVAELIETSGVHTVQRSLPEDVSGLTVFERNVGVLVVVNVQHHVLRRRFSLAHEYCHALVDRDRKATLSRASDRTSLLEVRANAFAAAFLMPAEGVRAFVRGLAKGQPSRLSAEIFDEEGAMRVEGRPAPGSQALQMHDVALVAHHFGVSRIAAVYRLKNLRSTRESEFRALLQQEEQGLGKAVAELLDLEEPDHERARSEFRHRFLSLGLEAFRRGEITRAKLRELAALVDVEDQVLDGVMARLEPSETSVDPDGGGEAS